MRLETEDGPAIENPTEDQIRQAIEGIGRESGSFAILKRCEEPPECIQTSGEGHAFIMECHEVDKHFRAADEQMTLEATLALFQAYNRGGDAWRGMAQWQDVTREAAGARWPVVALIGVVTAALVALILYYSFK
jgi:hypothetical protein